jgi:integrase
VHQQLLALSGQPMCLAQPKTSTSSRVSELPEAVSIALATAPQAIPRERASDLDRTDPRKPVQRAAALLFTTRTGAPVHLSNWAQIWRRPADTRDREGIGIHCLRHYYATVLIHQGADVKTVQLAMGHKTPMITLKTYAGEWPGAGGRTRSIIDAALGSVPSQCPDLEAKP